MESVERFGDEFFRRYKLDNVELKLLETSMCCKISFVVNVIPWAVVEQLNFLLTELRILEWYSFEFQKKELVGDYYVFFYISKKLL